MRIAQEPTSRSIAQVSTLLSIPIPTIRSWERRYDIGPARTPGGHRRYAIEDIELLRSIRDDVAAGRSPRDAVERALRARDALTLQRPAIQRVIDAALRLNPWEVRDALDAAAATLGVEQTITAVAIPAMHEVGERWEAGTCGVEGEHAATEGVRTWLARAGIQSSGPTRSGTIVMACGPAEMHTIGLEAFGVLLARRGWDVRVLGGQVPADALASASKEASAVIVTCQRAIDRRGTVSAIRRTARAVQVFYAGAGFIRSTARRGVRGTYLGDDMDRAIEIFERGRARARVR